MQSYHIARNGQQVGVFEEAEIRTGLGSGQFFPNDLYWGEGMADWQPLSSRFAAATASTIPAPTVNPYAAPLSQVPAVALGPDQKLASHGARLAAALLDSLVFLLAMIPLVVGMFLLAQMESADGTIDEVPAAAIGCFLLAAVLWIGLMIYNVVLLATRGQTLGKKWMHIRIVSYPGGDNPGFVKAALVRGFVNALIGQFVPFYAIVDVCFIFREDRRCLHDLIAETTVVGGDPAA